MPSPRCSSWFWDSAIRRRAHGFWPGTAKGSRFRSQDAVCIHRGCHNTSPVAEGSAGCVFSCDLNCCPSTCRPSVLEKILGAAPCRIRGHSKCGHSSQTCTRSLDPVGSSGSSPDPSTPDGSIVVADSGVLVSGPGIRRAVTVACIVEGPRSLPVLQQKFWVQAAFPVRN